MTLRSSLPTLAISLTQALLFGQFHGLSTVAEGRCQPLKFR
jgi:hypothetical protein